MPPETPSAQRKLDLHTEGSKTEIRRDYLHDYFVLVAPKRQDRPFDPRSTQPATLVETADSPRLDLQTTVYERLNSDNRWVTKVVENKYPALSVDNPLAYGRQELVIDTPLRNVAFGELPLEQISEILLTYQQRTGELIKSDHIKYVVVFRNDGSNAGASLAHAHSQIVGLPLVPPRLLTEARTIEAYRERTQKDPFDMIISLEQSTKLRVIRESDHWISFCPYASAWQMEAWVLPKRPVSQLSGCTSEEIDELARHTLDITRQLTELGASYNLSIEQGSSDAQRLTLKVKGRSVLSPRGGLELTTDIIVNAIPPESAADWYRRGLNP